MSRAWDILLGVSVLSIVGGAATLVFNMAKCRPVERPSLGVRGLNRLRALQRGCLFATVEPPIRYVAAWVEGLPLADLRGRVTRRLSSSGDYLGLSPDELLAMCALSAGSLGVAGMILRDVLTLSMLVPVCSFAFGLFAPWLHLCGVARERAKRVTRALPGAVDLASLCMGAGLDFPGSLKKIVESAADPTEPIVEEFNRILQELDLGHTRRRAMEGFAERISTERVREFVNSVVQAEGKGSPLTRVLAIQAQTQRLRRSIAAEELASEAALKLIGPMSLIFLCVIVLLLGPVVVRFTIGGFSAL